MVRGRFADARLEAIAAAKALHRQLGMRSRVASGEGFIDVFGVIEELGIPLVFQPLKSALGLCLPRPQRGIMITTQRGLHVQRFTGAHELGHDVLEHSGSVDHVVNYRAGLEPDDGQDLQEIAADAFAAEFMLPRWLYKYHVQKQGWTVHGHLTNPDIVYQLSLRMAASYEATCWGLISHNILKRGEASHLFKVQVASLKESAGQSYKPANSWANAWRISPLDDGGVLLGDHQDVIRLDLDEASGGGYQWEIERLKEIGFLVLADRNEIVRAPMAYGGASHRTVVLRPPERDAAHIELNERQPWQDVSDQDRSFGFEMRLAGKEQGGFARSSRFRPGADA